MVSATTATLIAVPPGDILRYIRLRWKILKHAKPQSTERMKVVVS